MSNVADLVNLRAVDLPLGGRTARPTGFIADATGASIDVEVVGVAQMGDRSPAWRDLEARAMEANVFYGPDFALSAFRHLSQAGRPVFVLATDRTDGALVGLVPVVLPRIALGQFELFGWRHDQLALGTPLLDGQRGYEAALAFMRWLGSQRAAGGILLPLVGEDGEAAATLRAAAAATGRGITRFLAHERAVLRGGADGVDAVLARAMPGRKIKELRRLRRRLEERGSVTLTRAVEARDVRDATEAFMALEASGWKGREGSAFLQNQGQATFLRSVTRSLAQEGRCRIDVLAVDGRPAAAGIVLGGCKGSFFWKTAYDESLAAFSPGVQLALGLTEHQLHLNVGATDSCAIADHPMIDRVWPDRTPVADWFIEANPDSAASTLARVGVSARVGLRSTAKSLYRMARKRGG